MSETSQTTCQSTKSMPVYAHIAIHMYARIYKTSMQSTTICTDPCRNSHAAGIPTEKRNKQSNDAMGLRTVPLKTTDTVQLNVLQLTRADRGCMHVICKQQVYTRIYKLVYNLST